MIGLSVSLCIKDIIRGKVALEYVEKIVAGTRCESAEDWDKVIKNYRDLYWRKDPDRAEAILRQLLQEGKVEQPRVQGCVAHNIAAGRWLL